VKNVRAVFLAASLAVLAACSGEPPPVALCPAGGILPEANTLVQFREGGGRDVTDMVVQGQIVDIRIGCVYATRRNRASVTLDLQIAFAAERGPADRTRRAALPYFIAIVDAERNVVVRENFIAGFEWTDNRPRVGRVDRWEPFIPLNSNAEGPGYQVVIGFQLTAEQLAWNRSQRQQR
jgi:hypothetical protein